MEKTNKAVNAGVHASTGFEFQKYCAINFLIEKYEDLKDRKYFICIEHDDDFLFCYQTKDGLISSIDAYQAKKASSPWTMSTEMYIIFEKMMHVGLDLNADSMLKIDSYKHNLEFITNNSISLNNGKKKCDAKTIIINESNSRMRFVDLDEEISKKIESEIKKRLVIDSEGLKELSNMSIGYIDFPKTSKQQKHCLVGDFNDKFRDKVNDSEAAVDILLGLFREVENTLNQGNIAKLMDKSKRVDCYKINEAIDVITTKKMAFNLWRQNEEKICDKLKIAIPDQKHFRLNFENSIDRFKDLQQSDHIRILSFVKENSNLIATSTNEINCIQELYEKFRNSITLQLTELDIKAAIYAAYIEVRDTL